MQAQHIVIPPPLYRPPGRPKHIIIKHRDGPNTEKRSQKNVANVVCLDITKKVIKVHLLLIRMEEEVITHMFRAFDLSYKKYF